MGRLRKYSKQNFSSETYENPSTVFSSLEQTNSLNVERWASECAIVYKLYDFYWLFMPDLAVIWACWQYYTIELDDFYRLSLWNETRALLGYRLKVRT
jgi:hypothetical protein